MTEQYPRDLIGYGREGKKITWPNGEKIALQFVINYEEGGENCILHGDKASEAFLSEMVAAQPIVGARNISMESLYEYGSRAGFWRLHKYFTEKNIPVTAFAVATAMQKNPAAVDAMLESQWDIASHGYKWIDYHLVEEDLEREHIALARDIHKSLTGEYPRGWYTGRNSVNTRKLVMEHDFLYDADSYADDLPYWERKDNGNPHLIVPYTLDTNDMRFTQVQGFNSGEQYFQYLKDAFDILYAEGEVGEPKMLSLGLHCRLIGKPARFAALKRFIEYTEQFSDVWYCTRAQIAEHWHQHYPMAK